MLKSIHKVCKCEGCHLTFINSTFTKPCDPRAETVICLLTDYRDLFTNIDSKLIPYS